MSHPTQPTSDKSHARALVETRLGAPVRDLLVRHYTDGGMTQAEIADLFGVGRQTVVRWMAEEGIPTRDRRAVVA